MQSDSGEGPAGGYAKALARHQDEQASARRRLERLGNVRLALAAAFVVLLLLPLFTRGGGPWLLLVPLTAAFLILGRQMDRADRQLRLVSALVDFYADGLGRHDGSWRTRGDDGADLSGEGAALADDLDLFGRGSLYQLIARCRTTPGRTTLARWLSAPAEAEVAAARLAVARGLAAQQDARARLFAAAGEAEDGALSADPLLTWVQGPSPSGLGGLRLCGLLCPFVAPASGVVAFGVMQQPAVFYLGIALHLAVSLLTRRWASARLGHVFGAERILARWTALFEWVEATDLDADMWKRLRRRLSGRDGEPASALTRAIRRLSGLLDARLNPVFALTVAPVLLWELNLYLALERHRRALVGRVGDWVEVLGEVEALASLAAFAWDRPSFCSPAWVAGDGGPCLEAEGLVHPLIDPDKAVANDVHLGPDAPFLLLSGSNMSGKSTYLRAIGLAHVLAGAGAPVPAGRFVLSPSVLGTSVQIRDSVQAESSHFHAEIRRLVGILAEARAGRPLVFLLDEIMHGTNSRERFIGAAAVIRELVRSGAVGVVTTHDLALTQVAAHLPAGAMRQAHFTELVKAGEMAFDYRLRAGPVQSTNALRIMKAMGIEIPEMPAEPPSAPGRASEGTD